jgi:serine/threonine-protein kinase
VIGEIIGHFKIVARAGRGAMGEVFIAEHVAIGTRVAIKVLHGHVASSTVHVQRFFNEARAVARIEHAGIVKIFDVGFHTEQRAYLIMEHLAGETLAARLRRTTRIALRDALEIARQIASILDATHHAGIIHRDLKPGNVFLVRDRGRASGERVKLLDFGIAKLSDTLDGAGPSTVGTLGTPEYMAPEQWSDASTVDWRADVYSLGCMIYEMASGRRPFQSRSIAEACAKHLHDAPPPIRSHAAWIPDAFDAFALRLLAKDRTQRAASIAELEQQLAALGAIVPAPGDEPPLPEPVAAPATPATEAALHSAIDPPPDRSFDRDSAPRSGPASNQTSDTPSGRFSDRTSGLSSDRTSELASAPPATEATTTLSHAATSGTTQPVRRRAVAAIAAVGLLAAGALVAWWFGGADSRQPPAAPPARSAAPAPAAIVAEPVRDAGAAPAQSFAAWLAAENRFVDWRGARWLAHQVTRGEYRRYLESLPAVDALRLQPVTGWSDGDPARPAAWITFERATAFCRAIGASLPTREQWLAASSGAWGLDPGGSGPGPLQEWTSTVRDGLVAVCGGHGRMAPSERAAAAADPLLKSSEVQAGPGAAPNVVAAETIGFRCVR